MKHFLTAVAFVSILGLTSEAYAGICIGRRGSICIGSANFCETCKKSRDATPSFVSSTMLVSIQGNKSFFASDVDVSEVDGNFGIVTVRQGEQILFNEWIDLAEVLIADAATGGYQSLAALASTEAVPIP